MFATRAPRFADPAGIDSAKTASRIVGSTNAAMVISRLAPIPPNDVPVRPVRPDPDRPVLPAANIDEEPPFLDVGDPPDRWCDELLGEHLVPDNRQLTFNAQQMIEAVVDDGSFFELAPGSRPALVAGLARVAGQAVGGVLQQPVTSTRVRWTCRPARTARVAELCDTFHLPMVYFRRISPAS